MVLIAILICAGLSLACLARAVGMIDLMSNSSPFRSQWTCVSATIKGPTEMVDGGFGSGGCRPLIPAGNLQRTRGVPGPKHAWVAWLAWLGHGKMRSREQRRPCCSGPGVEGERVRGRHRGRDTTTALFRAVQPHRREASPGDAQDTMETYLSSTIGGTSDTRSVPTI
ncbi:hypothetical protein F5Y18DRAFT_425995 [Xylariaceae sp. FL1019]|nr:hypothetical protein F5Y18DRAFT_425995 [Xylariaceae sp. FL1019]